MIKINFMAIVGNKTSNPSVCSFMIVCNVYVSSEYHILGEA